MSQAVETDLPSLAAEKAQHEEELRRDIVLKIQNHQNWNKNHVDLTKGPLSPLRSPSSKPPFRVAQAQYLLTPPASSASQDSLEEPEPMDLDDPEPPAAFKFQGAPMDENDPPKIAFRRRYGRLNRLWIDRRSAVKTPIRDDPSPFDQSSDQWKYDHDDSEDEQPEYEIDPYDTRCIRFRATIPLTFGDMRRPAPSRPPQALIQAQLEAQAQQAAAHAAANSNAQMLAQQIQHTAARQAASAQKQDS